LASISVAMPAYNEEENIAGMIEDVVTVMEPRFDDYEIIVVDDGSRDRTAEVVREMITRYPQVRLVQHPVNQGYGAAVYTGLTSATKDLVFFTDSDRQFVLEEIDRLLPHLAHADLVIGYRAPRRDPFIRRLNGWGWTWLVNILFGYVSRDVDCAFKLMRREVVETVCPKVRSRGATFSAEFLVRAKRAGFRIREVPVSHRPRVAGSQTGARLDVILRAFRELIRFRWQLWQE